MDKMLVRKDVAEELIEKGYGKRDLSKLTIKTIIDKNGHARKVYVRTEQNKTGGKPSKTTKEIDKIKETEELLNVNSKNYFPLNDIGSRAYHFKKNGENKWELRLVSHYDTKPKPVAADVKINDDGSITLHGYKTYGEVVADKNSDYARKNVLLSEISVKITPDELREKKESLIGKLRGYAEGYSSNQDFEIKKLR